MSELRKIITRLLSIFLGLFLYSQIIGCTVAKVAESTQGTDIKSISKNISREEVESVLGAPLREWETSSNLRYCLYIYDVGVPAGPAFVASIWHIFADIGSGFEWEAHMMTDQRFAKQYSIEDSREQAVMAIAYDKNNIVVEVYKDVESYSELPEGAIDKDLLLPNKE